jgi:Flp pilus assembly protein TadD
LFLEKSSPAEALEHLQKAAELAPENAEYREALARFQKNP